VVDRTFTLAPNEVASVHDGAFELRFDRVLKDERCGAAALCVAGVVTEAVLQFDVVTRKDNFSMQSKAQMGTWTGKATIGGYNVSIEQLAPYPIGQAKDEIKPEDYRVTLRITSAATS
jgi:hypothetical protein